MTDNEGYEERKVRLIRQAILVSQRLGVSLTEAFPEIAWTPREAGMLEDHFNGATYAKIARAHGISGGRVGQIIAKARRRALRPQARAMIEDRF